MGDYEIVYHADIRCYWCGCDCGTVSSRKPINEPGEPIAYNPRGAEAVVVRRLGEVRCPRCRGPVYAENPEKRRIYPDFVFRQRRPRRPKVAPKVA
jgi:hypothetical protein